MGKSLVIAPNAAKTPDRPGRPRCAAQMAPTSHNVANRSSRVTTMTPNKSVIHQTTGRSLYTWLPTSGAQSPWHQSARTRTGHPGQSDRRKVEADQIRSARPTMAKGGY
jgi:hypothetical protein